MFDFPVQESSVGTSIYCLCFYLVIFVSNYRYLKYPFKIPVSKNRRKTTLFLIVFFLVAHCMQGDFFSLMHRVYDYSSVPGVWNFGEEIYHKIGLAVHKNYLLFRIIVWGGAFTLYCLTAKRMNVSVYYAAVLLLVTHSIIFAYARVTLAMAFYFWGLSFICNPIRKSKWFSYVIGICIIIISMEFHRSAIIMVCMTGMLFIPVRKWTIVLMLLLIPLFLNFFNDLLLNIAQSENTNEIIAQKIQHYSDRDFQQGISGILISFLEYVSFYVPFILSAICIFCKNNKGKIPVELFKMYKVTIGLVIVSLTFNVLGSSYVTFSYRILFMSMIPLTLTVVRLFQCNLMNYKHFSLCVYSGFSYVIVKYIYTIYCHIV